MFAVQHKETGQLVDLFPTIESANAVLERYDCLEVVPDTVTKLEVWYIDLGGPSGYGCKTPEFTTYGGFKQCLVRLKKFEQRSASLFGPDIRDIRDYLCKCSVYINDKNLTENWIKYLDSKYINSNKEIYA